MHRHRSASRYSSTSKVEQSIQNWIHLYRYIVTVEWNVQTKLKCENAWKRFPCENSPTGESLLITYAKRGLVLQKFIQVFSHLFILFPLISVVSSFMMCLFSLPPAYLWTSFIWIEWALSVLLAIIGHRYISFWGNVFSRKMNET